MTWDEIRDRLQRMQHAPFTLDYWVLGPDQDFSRPMAIAPRVWAARPHLLRNLLDILPRP